MRILLIEDDLLLAEALAEAMIDAMYIVDVLSDGEMAWEQVQKIDYDLVITDLMLPKLDGIGLCQKLRSHGYQKPIMVISARNQDDDLKMASQAGANDYLVKPIDLLDLLARIEKLVGPE